MKLGGHASAAIEVLKDIESRHRPASDVLRDWGLSHRFAGSSDRSAIANIVYDVLRCRLSSSWVLDDSSPRSMTLGLLMLEWAIAPLTLQQMLSNDKFSPSNLEDLEINLALNRLSEPTPDHIRANCPDWCIPRLQKVFDSEWVEEAYALSRRPPLDLRVNTLLSNRYLLLQELQENNPTPCSLSPEGIRIIPTEKNNRLPNIRSEPAFQKGFIEIQDEGSQIVVQLSEAKPHMNILDFCAGAGGKTLSLAAMIHNTGCIFAYDSDKFRFAPIFERLKRSEVRNVQTISKAKELEPLKEKMDIVFVDAPCTGSGVWRRRPDTKWRLSLHGLEQRIHQQKAILDIASRFVKPGGKLIYVTCSLFDEENHQRISSFSRNNSSFTPVDHEALWNKCFPQHRKHARKTVEGISLSPFITNTDGFFFSALQRKN